MKIEDFLDKPLVKKRDKEIILNIEQKIENQIVSKEVEEDQDAVKFDNFLKLVDTAINATKGLKKIIEQTQEKDVIPANPKEKQIMKSLLNVNSEAITFEIYQQAIAMREKLVMSQMRKAMLDEQFK